jgi:3-methyladenine DNA glycosylase AlkD
MDRTPSAIASEIDGELRELGRGSRAPQYRAVRRRHSRLLRAEPGPFVLEVGRALVHEHGHRWFACELVRYHRKAFALVGGAELQDFGRGINSWGSVDGFARLLSGPAWLRGQVPDDLIHGWARSDDRWWRRAALVSTVALNVRSRGGMGDVPRTLAVCRMLASDRDDMVVKAMSWALRELVVHDPDAVRAFLDRHDDVLAARVKREVRNKLETGLKNPRRGAESQGESS